MREAFQRYAMFVGAGATSAFMLNQGDRPFCFGVPSLVVACISTCMVEDPVEVFVFLSGAMFGAGFARLQSAQAMMLKS